MLVLVKLNKNPEIAGIFGQNITITLKSIYKNCTKKLTKCRIEKLLFQFQFRSTTPLSRNYVNYVN